MCGGSSILQLEASTLSRAWGKASVQKSGRLHGVWMPGADECACVHSWGQGNVLGRGESMP